MDPGVEEGPLHVEAGHVACGGDVADGFHHQDDVDGHQGQDDGRVDAEGEGLDPDEGDGGRGVDARGGEVARRARDDAADQEADDHGAGLHDGAAEAFAEDDGHEDGEAEPDVLGAAPGEGVRRPDLRADGVGTAGWPRDAAGGAGPAGPVLEAALDQSDPDEHDGGAGDERREDALQDRGLREGEADFE